MGEAQIQNSQRGELLSCKDLRVQFQTRKGVVEAVKGISFAMGREKVGIVGESGSGKSMTARAILDMIRYPGGRSAREISFDGQDILNLTDKQMRKIRGRRISMVMQDPKYSLNPTMTVDTQLLEAWKIHIGGPRKAGRQAILDMLSAVLINDPERVAKNFPHELSGGIGQRVMIAMMLIPEPDLLIADEPTSALDVTVQLEVLQLIDDLVTRNGMGLLFISHDLPLVSHFCDRVIIMNSGRIVEECAASDLHQAKHPYTQGLMACLPDYAKRGTPLTTLSRQQEW